MNANPLDQAIAASRSVLANVTPAQLQDPTPCASWNVAALINHMVGAPSFFVSALKGEAPAGGSDAAEGDFLAAFDEATSQLSASFQEEGVMQRTIKLPFGEMPGAAVMGLGAVDTFAHAWDLAKATGQSTDLNPELAAALLAQSRQAISANFRGPEGAPFAAEKPCPEGACNADQLAAFLGRDV